MQPNFIPQPEFGFLSALDSQSRTVSLERGWLLGSRQVMLILLLGSGRGMQNAFSDGWSSVWLTPPGFLSSTWVLYMELSVVARLPG